MQVMGGELCVPPECECILKVPIQLLTRSFDVVDPSGAVVLQVRPQAVRSSPFSKGAVEPFSFTLSTEGGPVLAQCYSRGDPSQESTEVHILNGASDHQATLRRQGGNHIIETAAGDRLTLTGGVHTRRLSIQASDSSEVAATQPDQDDRPNYILQVQPLCDVGLVLCALLSVSHVAMAKRRGNEPC